MRISGGMTMIPSSSELFSLIPRIRRAKDFHLYDDKGRRYLDLYLNRGHAILGHRRKVLTKTIKDVISRGLIFDMPSVYEARLKKALSVLFPAYESFITADSADNAFKRLKLVTGIEVLDEIHDPLIPQRDADHLAGNNASKGAGQEISIWRPFSNTCDSRARILVPVLPFSVSCAPFVLCIRDRIDTGISPPVSPFLLAGLIRGIYDLLKYSEEDWLPRTSFQPNEDWNLCGIYLVSRLSPERYKAVFERFLSEGVLLSPFFPGPSILPQEASSGELAKLKNLFNEK